MCRRLAGRGRLSAAGWVVVQVEEEVELVEEVVGEESGPHIDFGESGEREIRRGSNTHTLTHPTRHSWQ